MLLLTLFPDCVIIHVIQSFLSMKDLLVLACTSKRMGKYTASSIKQKVDRDARLLLFAEALMERVNMHTGLSIRFSIDRFRPIRKAIVYNGYLVFRLGPISVVTIFDGKLTLVHGLSFCFSEEYGCSKSVNLTIGINEVRGVKTFKCEIRSDSHQCCKIAEGTSFEAILDLFPPKAAHYWIDRNAEQRHKSDESDREVRALLAQTNEMLDKLMNDSKLDEVNHASWRAGRTETRDDDSNLLGDDECFIVKDADKTSDDDSILLGDDECFIVEDSRKTSDDGCILLGDDDCLILEDE